MKAKIGIKFIVETVGGLLIITAFLAPFEFISKPATQGQIMALFGFILINMKFKGDL